MKSSGEQVDWEGCLSIPGFVAEVSRAAKVTVKARDRHGREFRVKGDGLFARALQHEIDHLNGRLYIDHLESGRRAGAGSGGSRRRLRGSRSRHLVGIERIGRIAFLGTGAFGVPLLERVADLADELMVVSQPDRPAGRRLQMRATPIAVAAREHGIPVLTPARLRSDVPREELARFDPDGIVLVAYGQIVPPDLLRIGRRPPLNVHPSLLPRHRGAAPVAGTILAGDPEGGVTLMVMTEELDAGPIVARWPVALAGRETTPELEARLADLAAEVVPPVLRQWARGDIETEPQDDRIATHDPSVHPRGRLDRLAAAGGRDRPAGARASALARRVDDDRRPPPPCPPGPSGGGRGWRHDRAR